MIDRIISQAKRDDVLGILHSHHPPHAKRLWLVGFLKYAGYSEADIYIIIQDENNWDNFDQAYARYQISSVFRSRRRAVPARAVSSNAQAIGLDGLINEFIQNTSPIIIEPPSRVDRAAWYYYFRGYIVLPKHENGKYPALPWREYVATPPTERQLDSWDFSNGLCLLSTQTKSFLDIDIPGYAGIFSQLGYHFEFTPRGGIHVFGQNIDGAAPSISTHGGELKGLGTLIVAHPSPGYAAAPSATQSII
jgi:hypothetical protein